MNKISIPERIFVYGKPVDMRKSFDGLFVLVAKVLGEDPMSGDLFIKKIRATKSQAIVDDLFDYFKKELHESILLPDRRWCSPERNPLQSAIDLHTPRYRPENLSRRYPFCGWTHIKVATLTS